MIHKVLNDLHEQGELEHVDLLYPPGTFPQSSSLSEPAKRARYTFEKFVDHLDVNDATFRNLIELLVTTTARKAIARAANLGVDESHDGQQHAEQSARASADVFDRYRVASSSASAITDRAASLRTARACQREMMRNRALQGEIRGITRRSRRLHRSNSSDSSASESVAALARSPPPTRTVFSSLLDPPSYPPLQSVMAGADGSTTRASRVGQGSTTYRWLQRDLSSMRRRAQRQDLNTGGNDESATHVASRDSNGNFYMTNGASDSGHARYYQPDLSVVQRFLSQPWTTDAQSAMRTGNGYDGRIHSEVAAAEASGLDATLAPTLDIERRSSSPDLFTSAALSLDPTGIEMRTGSADPTRGSQARLDAIHAALNRLSSSAPLPSSDPVGPMSLASLPPSYEIVGGRSDSITEFNTHSARRRQAQRARRTAADEHRARSETQEEQEDREALDRALASLTEADATISEAVQRVNEDSLHAAIGQAATSAVETRHRPIVRRQRIRSAESRGFGQGQGQG